MRLYFAKVYASQDMGNYWIDYKVLSHPFNGIKRIVYLVRREK